MRKQNKCSFKNCMSFVFSRISQKDKSIFGYSLVRIPFSVFNRLADVYSITLIVDAVSKGDEKKLIWTVFAFSFYKLFSGIIMHFANWKLEGKNYNLRMDFVSGFVSQYMRTPFSTIESPQGKNIAKRAQNTMMGTDHRNKPPVESFLPALADLSTNLLGLFVYSGIIAILNPLIILLLLFTSVISYWGQRSMVRYDQKDKDKYIPLDRRLWYFIKEMRDIETAKDIRVFGMTKWLKQLFEENLLKRMKIHVARSHYQFFIFTVINVANVALTAFTYVFLFNQYFIGNVDISGFVLYFGLITGFNSWLMSVINGVERVHKLSLDVEDLIAFQNLSTTSKANACEQNSDLQGSIRFENVTFGYQEDQVIIQDMNFYIPPGKKVALVGENGAGKTTLIKLLCGLYSPQKGQIYLDGKSIDSFKKEDLFSKLAVVFQDIYLLPTTIERNITLSNSTDKERFYYALSLSGLKEKISTLPKREKTLLGKGILEEATNFSGGEIQKLALARALYKGGEIFILDEPTSKLDPLAESEIYQKYNQLVQEKTSLFISHRLSSTQFCDLIFYLEEGTIKEVGTHDELMQLNGAYAKMFQIQSRYYCENSERKENYCEIGF